MKSSRSTSVKAAAIAGVMITAMGTATVAEAHVFASVGVNLPGVSIGVTNGGYYTPPVYVQPAPVYYQPAPVYYEPAPVYYEPAPVYYQPQTYYAPSSVYVRPAVYGVTYVRSRGHHRGHHYGNPYYR